MQRLVPNQHAVFIMVLRFCLDIVGVSETTNENVNREQTHLKTLENNNTDLLTCNNCSNTVEENCTISQGWNLKGSDWGCCGNYAGCCTYASYVCYIHDALCKCCDVGVNFCGPTCKPEVDCPSFDQDTMQSDEEFKKATNSTSLQDTVDADKALNNTDNHNGTKGNYFLRGRAASGTSENSLQDGLENEDGSGEVES